MNCLKLSEIREPLRRWRLSTVTTVQFYFHCFLTFFSDLPAPFRKEGSAEVCLIIKDTSKDKLFDQERGVLRFKEYLRTCGVVGITEVNDTVDSFLTYCAIQPAVGHFLV